MDANLARSGARTARSPDVERNTGDAPARGNRATTNTSFENARLDAVSADWSDRAQREPERFARELRELGTDDLAGREKVTNPRRDAETGEAAVPKRDAAVREALDAPSRVRFVDAGALGFETLQACDADTGEILVDRRVLQDPNGLDRAIATTLSRETPRAQGLSALPVLGSGSATAGQAGDAGTAFSAAAAAGRAIAEHTVLTLPDASDEALRGLGTASRVAGRAGWIGVAIDPVAHGVANYRATEGNVSERLSAFGRGVVGRLDEAVVNVGAGLAGTAIGVVAVGTSASALAITAIPAAAGVVTALAASYGYSALQNALVEPD